MASAGFTSPRVATLDWVAEFLKQELSPYPGRMVTVLRMVTACVITMLLVLIFQLPNGFLAVFYALAISRQDPQTTVRNGFAIILGNLAGLALSVAGMALFIDHYLLHFLFVVGVFFLAFFVTRTLANYAVAFGFSIIVMASASVNIIWARTNPLRPDLAITFWTGFGMILGTFAVILTEWVFASPAAGAVERPAQPQLLFVTDAFSNTEYVAFALKGCLAATICYLVWSALAWPGMGVCTVTCVIAAPLSTPGSSKQRLITRLSGLLVGGVLCGIGSQIFILPYVDSIVGFTLAFAAVSGAAAWAATSSVQFLYFGRQMALAYYLAIFEGFGINSSLVMSRDRLMGVFLGIIVMWLVFDAAGKRTVAWNIPREAREAR